MFPVWDFDHLVGEESAGYFVFLGLAFVLPVRVCLHFLLVSMAGFVLYRGSSWISTILIFDISCESSPEVISYINDLKEKKKNVYLFTDLSSANS